MFFEAHDVVNRHIRNAILRVYGLLIGQNKCLVDIVVLVGCKLVLFYIQFDVILEFLLADMSMIYDFPICRAPSIRSIFPSGV
ncbi:hypothetical protein HMPREF9141_0003 [Prevotella multiformis DSM 16608]|uniref:Uncharacterized protein n=1 Tax=Prevotella multiformis DSM 16608 TaxID=888743 RepID=F0F337_9BACT|nr:hypothetical protein HMPREF9141_0003 [Prevotella multiformis DSM 16608]